MSAIDEEEAEAAEGSAVEAVSRAPTHGVDPVQQMDSGDASNAPGMLGKALGWVKSLVRGIANHFRGKGMAARAYTGEWAGRPTRSLGWGGWTRWGLVGPRRTTWRDDQLYMQLHLC